MSAQPDTEVDVDVPLDQLAWQTAALKAIGDSIGVVYEASNAELRRRVIARYQADGTPTTIIKTPDTGVEIARATVTIPSDKPVVTDREAFAEWVEREAPTEVQYEVVAPPDFMAQVRELLDWYDGDRTAVTIRRVVRPTYQSALLESGITFVPVDPQDPAAGVAAVRGSGDVVPGVGVQPAGPPTSHQVRFATKARTGAKTAENQLNGRQRTIAALQRTGFTGLTLQDVLDEARQIEG